MENLFTYDPGSCAVTAGGTNKQCEEATSQVACMAASQGLDTKDACQFAAGQETVANANFWKDRHSIADDGVITVKASVVRKLDERCTRLSSDLLG